MPTFKIDENSVCDIIIKKEWSMYANQKTLTNEELIKVIKGLDRCSSITNDDHPEFKALREKLGDLGYISIERGWWNGDRVLKPFTLNGAKFKKGDKFVSGAAMKWELEHRRKNHDK
jgi:hypothetical protein